MINKSSNFICTCGHTKRQHHNVVNGGRILCFFKGMITTNDDCPCNNYKPDNLKYLEAKYNETH